MSEAGSVRHLLLNYKVYGLILTKIQYKIERFNVFFPSLLGLFSKLFSVYECGLLDLLLEVDYVN